MRLAQHRSGGQLCARATWSRRAASSLLHRERRPGPRRRPQRGLGRCVCQSTSAADAYPLPEGELGLTEDLGTIVYKASLHRLPTESSAEGSQLSVSVDSEGKSLKQWLQYRHRLDRCCGDFTFAHRAADGLSLFAHNW